MRKSFLTAAAALLVLAGCGSESKIDPDQGAAELGLNRGPQDFAGPAASTEQAARRLAQDDVQKAGGDWSIEIADCKKSGPVTSCDMVVKGTVKPGGKRLTCSATAAVRIRAERATAHRTPFACGPGA